MENFFPHYGKLLMRQLSTSKSRLSLFAAGLLAAAGLLGLPSPTNGREVRVATFNFEHGPGDPGSDKYNAIRDQLERMDADVVGFQEMRSATFGVWSNLATELGYDYSVIGEDNGSRAGYLFNGYFSHYPILSSYNIISPTGASEMARFPFRAVIDIPDAQNPLIVWNLHHKSGGNNIDKFRRAVEAYRTVQDVDAYLTTNPTHLEYVVMGDMNDDVRDNQIHPYYTNQPSGAPASYILGSDITFPVAYAIFPSDRYEDAGVDLHYIPAYWEGTTTPITRPESGRQLDYMFLSTTLVNSPLGMPKSEIYYSDMDLGAGLPKVGSPLPAGTSATASDHLPIFVDIQMVDFSSVLPTAAFASIGERGGPFDPEVATYTLTETNVFDTDWTALADVDWLTLSDAIFTLSPFVPLDVDVELNANAELLMPGAYEASVSFYNETTGLEEIRGVSLIIRDFFDVSPTNGFIASGYAGESFTPTAQVYTISNKSTAAHTLTATATNNWVTVTPSSWMLNAGGTVDVTVSLNANADVLPIGAYEDTVTFSNQTTGLIQERSIALSVKGSLCNAVDDCGLTWSSGGDADWFYQSTNTSDGVDAAQSGPITSSQSSWMETVVTGPVQIAFHWQVSSRTNYHTLSLSDNDSWQTQISGEVPWVRQSYEVASGIHTLRWTYATSSSSPEGSNAGGVDQITFDYLTVTPTGSWDPSGVPGGPFTPAMQSYVLTNTGPDSLQWTASTNVPWLTATPVSGTLVAGESATVEVSLNELADELASGTHAGSITFSNSTTGDSFDRLVSLNIQDSMVVTPPSYSLHFGFVNGPYPATTNAFSVSNSGTSTLTWSLSNSADWVETDILGGTLEAGASTNIMVTFTAQADALPAGYSYTPFLFSNETAQLSQSRNFWIFLEEPLDITTGGGIFSGPVGGPFDPTFTTYTVTNQSPVTQEWLVASAASWLTLDASGGILPPNSSTQVIASLNAEADALVLGVYSTSVIFSNLITGATLPQSISLSVGIEFCDALEACDLDWTFGGDASWFYQTNATQDGVDAAASGTITHSEESWMETTVTGPADLSFEWKVSSEGSFDYLELWVDGIRSNRIAGTVDWETQTIALTSGTHVVRWRYMKDGSVSSGEDRGWVDQVTWAPGRTAMGVPVVWYERFGLAPEAYETWDNLDLQTAASGAPNWFQYLSGLDPTEPDDIFVIHSIQRSDGQPTEVTWWGGTNGPVAPYVIESTTNLYTGPWEAIDSSPRVTGLNTWTNPVPEIRMEHYRIQASPDP